VDGDAIVGPEHGGMLLPVMLLILAGAAGGPARSVRTVFAVCLLSIHRCVLACIHGNHRSPA
jgi:hypothetical protein